jgi:S-adenosylmethionine decarboxylase
VAFHTYPELGYAAVDVFSCGRGDPREAAAAFREWLRPDREELREAERGRALEPAR